MNNGTPHVGVTAEPADIDALKAVEQRARLLARMEGQEPNETYEQPHPDLAGVKVTHIAWHVFARRLLTMARMLTALKSTEEQAAASNNEPADLSQKAH